MNVLSGPKHHLIITAVWAVILLGAYLFVVDLNALPTSVFVPTHHNKLVEAVVLIAGGAMARSPLVDLSVQSIRRVGGFEGDIYVLTDHPECFSSTIKMYGIRPIRVPEADMATIVKIKTIKAKLFSYLPDSLHHILYMDVDVVVAALDDRIPWWSTLPTGKRVVLASMAFQLGVGGLMKFRKFLAAAEDGDDHEAVAQMRDSAWYRQTTNRVEDLIKRWNEA